MSEHQSRRPSESGKQTKREKLAEIRMDESLDDEQVKRLTRKHSPWSDWLMNEYAQYWYWLGVLAADAFVLMDVAGRYHVRDSAGFALAARRAGIASAHRAPVSRIRTATPYDTGSPG